MNFVIIPVFFYSSTPPPSYTGRGLCECRVKAMGLKKHIIADGSSLYVVNGDVGLNIQYKYLTSKPALPYTQHINIMIKSLN